VLAACRTGAIVTDPGSRRSWIAQARSSARSPHRFRSREQGDHAASGAQRGNAWYRWNYHANDDVIAQAVPRWLMLSSLNVIGSSNDIGLSLSFEDIKQVTAAP